MRSLEERFADLIDRLNTLDPRAPTTPLDELAKELRVLDSERTTVASDARHYELTRLSKAAASALERQVSAARNPTARHARTPRSVSAFAEQARRDLERNRGRGIER